MAEAPDLSTTFDALAHPHRRLVLYYLREHRTAPLWRLADVVTGWSTVVEGGGSATPADREAVAAALHHAHLPKLARAGLLTLDREAGTATMARPSALLEQVLDLALECERFGEAGADAGLPGVDADASWQA